MEIKRRKKKERNPRKVSRRCRTSLYRVQKEDMYIHD